MSIPCDEPEIVFQHQCRDPEVVIGARSADAFQLHKEARVVLSRLPAREQNPTGCLSE